MKESAKSFMQKAVLSTAGFSAAISPIEATAQANYYDNYSYSHFAEALPDPSPKETLYTVIGQENSQEIEKQSEFLKGFTFLEFGYEGLGEYMDAYREDVVGPVLDRMKKDGANSVSYVFPYYQAGPFDSEMSLDNEVTPKDEVIRAFVNEAHERNLQVILRPIMYLEDDSQYWRGQIQPDNPQKWFASHGEVMNHYVELAQEEDVEYFSFGSELTSMENPEYTSYWNEILTKADNDYDGKILFSINWGSLIYGTGINTELLSNPAIDEIGLSYYYEHPDVLSGASEKELLQSLNDLPLYEIKTLNELTGKDILIVEAGATSTDAPWQHPWSTPSGKPNQQDQATYYEALCEAVVGREDLPFIVGVQTWNEGATSLDIDPKTDIGFEIFNKEAEQSVKECFTDES
jgi:hypothetical protein